MECQKRAKNAHPNFAEPNVMSSHCAFCPNNSPKHKDSTFIIVNDTWKMTEAINRLSKELASNFLTADNTIDRWSCRWNVLLFSALVHHNSCCRHFFLCRAWFFLLCVKSGFNSIKQTDVCLLPVCLWVTLRTPCLVTVATAERRKWGRQMRKVTELNGWIIG